MKSNLISSGFVNLPLCLHCGAFSRFASFGIASAPKCFLACFVMETQHMEITCCTMGECNCACMPEQNTFGRVGLFLSAFPFFVQFPFLPLVSLKVFSPIQPFLAFLYLVCLFVL